MTNLATYLFETGQHTALFNLRLMALRPADECPVTCTIRSHEHTLAEYGYRPKDAPKGPDGIERRRQQKRDYMRRVRARAKVLGVKESRRGFCSKVREQLGQTPIEVIHA